MNMNEYATRRAIAKGQEELEALVQAAEGQVADLRRYLSAYNDSASVRDKANQVRFAIHYVSCNRSIRLDVLSDAAAELQMCKQEEQS